MACWLGRPCRCWGCGKYTEAPSESRVERRHPIHVPGDIAVVGLTLSLHASIPKQSYRCASVINSKYLAVATQTCVLKLNGTID